MKAYKTPDYRDGFTKGIDYALSLSGDEMQRAMWANYKSVIAKCPRVMPIGPSVTIEVVDANSELEYGTMLVALKQ